MLVLLFQCLKSPSQIPLLYGLPSTHPYFIAETQICPSQRPINIRLDCSLENFVVDNTQVAQVSHPLYLHRVTEREQHNLSFSYNMDTRSQSICFYATWHGYEIFCPAGRLPVTTFLPLYHQSTFIELSGY